jgi:hypothetical protein
MQMACELVGVAGFEPAASSSRSHLATSTATAWSCPTWAASSANVRCCLPLMIPMVTRLVTRLQRAALEAQALNYLIRRVLRTHRLPAQMSADLVEYCSSIRSRQQR